MPERSRAALALFAKAPRPGRVKTRLAAALGARLAAEFHRECVLAAWQRISRLDGIELFLYCDSQCAEFEELAGGGRFRRQRGADLGHRMRSCLEELLGSGYDRALIVGSDAPTLPLQQVREALAALDEADAVLGPCADGGFTLIGASRTAPEMFRGVPWSTAGTRQACLRALRADGLTAAEVATEAYDVDTSADLARLVRDPALGAGLRRWLDRRLGALSQQIAASARPQLPDH